MLDGLWRMVSDGLRRNRRMGSGGIVGRSRLVEGNVRRALEDGVERALEDGVGRALEDGVG